MIGITDTLLEDELGLRRTATQERHPYTIRAKANAQGHRWGVLEPPAWRLDLLCFTICRLDYAILIRVDARHAGFHVHCATCVEDSVAFIRKAIEAVDGALKEIESTAPVVDQPLLVVSFGRRASASGDERSDNVVVMC